MTEALMTAQVDAAPASDPNSEVIAASDPNSEAIAAWDGPLYDRFVRFRPLVTTGLASHGEQALRLYPPRPGERVLDIGCGFGDTTQRIGALVEAGGEVIGVDAAPRFVATAAREAVAVGAQNVRFAIADVQAGVPDGPYDLAYSRFGTMFFANPVVALRNVRCALTPGGRLVMVVWRRRTENEWLHLAQTIVEGIVQRPAEYKEPTCGPGPFSMADADTVSAILVHAGYHDIALCRCDRPITIGRSLDEAIDVVMALGPAGEILRLQGERAAHLHRRVRAALRDGLSALVTPHGVIGRASTWIVTGVAPGA